MKKKLFGASFQVRCATVTQSLVWNSLGHSRIYRNSSDAVAEEKGQVVKVVITCQGIDYAELQFMLTQLYVFQ